VSHPNTHTREKGMEGALEVAEAMTQGGQEMMRGWCNTDDDTLAAMMKGIRRHRPRAQR